MKVSTSFVQDQRHTTKSQRFSAVQPSHIAAVLDNHGFNLVHLKSATARKQDNAAHQTTIARYRSAEEFKVGGLHMDLVFKVPHLYGSVEAFLGTYRLVCTNGLVVGSRFFEAPRIRHAASALPQLESLIPQLVAKHDELFDTIREMGARTVTPIQVADFVREAARLRLGENDKIESIDYGDLMRIRRPEDNGNDAFTVLNVVQENLMRFGLQYQMKTVNEAGKTSIRNMLARPVTRTKLGDTESTRSVDLNASVWDAAAQILMKIG